MYGFYIKIFCKLIYLYAPIITKTLELIKMTIKIKKQIADFAVSQRKKYV